MRGQTSAILVLSLVVLGLSAVNVYGQDKPSETEWKADPEAAKRLGDAVEVEGYSLRIPKGYESQDNPAPASMKMKGWAGPKRKDTTRASLTMAVITIPPAESEKMKKQSLEQIAERLTQGIKRRRTNWKQEEPEKATINGIEFVRIRWSGTNPEANREMKGFTYVAMEGAEFFSFPARISFLREKRDCPSPRLRF